MLIGAVKSKGWDEVIAKLKEKKRKVKMNMNTLILDSVGSCIDDTGVVYPMNVDNTPDTDNGTHIEDVVGEWWDNLSNGDLSELADWLVEHNIEYWSNNDEYTDEELMELEFISKYESGEYTDLDELL